MNRPPPLGRIFSAYLRMLFLSAIAFIGLLAIALRFGWPLPKPIEDLIREQVTTRVTAAPAGQ